MKDIVFMTVSEFRNETNSAKIDVVRNPKTGKLFITNGVDKWRCEQELDFEGDVKILIEDKNIDDACMVNVDDSKNVLKSFS